MDQDKRGYLAGRLHRGRKEFSMILRQPVLAVTIFIIMGTLILFVLYPMARIVHMSFTGEAGRPSLRAMMGVLTSRSYQITFRNSIFLAFGTSILSTITGYIFAFAVTRTEMPGKRFFRTLIQLPIISPPFILALSIIFLFGRQGIITRNIFGITDTNVYGGGSLLAIQVISFFPTAFLTLTGILSSIDTSVEDAALNMGSGRWHIFRTVTFPLSLPGVISAALLTFVQSLEDFSNPAVIGGNFSTLAVETYHTITGLYDLHAGSALALILLLPTVCAFMLQRYWLGKRSFVTVTGKPAQVTRKLHGPILPVLFFFCGTVSLIIILFYGTVAAGAFARTWGINYSLGLSHLKYAWAYGKAAILNSLILSVISVPITGFLGIIIAYLTTRLRFPGRRVMQVSSLLTFAIPGTVLGLSYISAFNAGPIVLTGTAAILVIVFVVRNMSVSIEAGSSTLMQIDSSIEEASAILGAGNGTTFRRITLPLLKQPFFAGMVFSFVRSMTAVSTVIFLTSPRWPLSTSKVYALFEIGRYSAAAAMTMIMIVIILLAIGIINFLVQLALKPRAHPL